MKKIIAGILAFNALLTNAQEKPNILFIAVDDLKPLIGSYGADFMKTPNMDKLSDIGVTYMNAHCQQAVCGPSRASLMTGMRPDYTGVLDLKTRMRDINPNILTMPEYFKNNGYKTVAIGKIYDPRCVDEDYDDPSWSIPYKESSEYNYPEEYGEPALSYYALPHSKEKVKIFEEEAKKLGQQSHQYVSERYKPSTEKADVPDDAYIDGQIANNALSYMKELSQNKSPFFLAVGFKRPHLPFAAPSKYWDMYKRDEIQLANYREAVINGVDIAYHNSGELQSYTDIPPLSSFTDINTMILPDEKQKELIHGYYAAVSFIDAQIGKLMNQLKALDLDKNTIIVLWGDHGWHLGDHNLWCKHSNFEQATRVPLIISSPGFDSGKYYHPAEFVDIFPTLCELSGIPIPEHLQGTSLVPTLSDNNVVIKPVAVSQFSRGKRIGYSLRNDRFRLTLWMEEGYQTYLPFSPELIFAGELYDYENDPFETINIYNTSVYNNVRNQMTEIFADYVAIQNNQLKHSGSVPQMLKSIKPASSDFSFLKNTKDFITKSRNGAISNFYLKNGVFFAEVTKTGDKPWDVGINSKETLDLKTGDEVTFSFFHNSKAFKLVLKSDNNDNIVQNIEASNGKQISTTFNIEQTGSYEIKMDFPETGVYEIWDFVIKSGAENEEIIQNKSLIKLSDNIEDNWNLTIRRGAKATFSSSQAGILTANVEQMGEKLWDLQMESLYNYPLQSGQTVVIKMNYKGPGCRLTIGPYNDERIVRKIDPNSGKKEMTIKIPVKATGEYPVKISFTSEGEHKLWNIKSTIE